MFIRVSLFHFMYYLFPLATALQLSAVPSSSLTATVHSGLPLVVRAGPQLHMHALAQGRCQTCVAAAAAAAGAAAGAAAAATAAAAICQQCSG